MLNGIKPIFNQVFDPMTLTCCYCFWRMLRIQVIAESICLTLSLATHTKKTKSFDGKRWGSHKMLISDVSSLQCYSVLSAICVKNELRKPFERWLNDLSTGEGFICPSPPSKLKIAVRFCSIYKQTISFSAIVFEVIFIQWPMMIMSRDWVSSVSYCSIYKKSLLLEKLLKIVVTSLT